MGKISKSHADYSDAYSSESDSSSSNDRRKRKSNDAYSKHGKLGKNNATSIPERSDESSDSSDDHAVSGSGDRDGGRTKQKYTEKKKKSKKHKKQKKHKKHKKSRNASPDESNTKTCTTEESVFDRAMDRKGLHNFVDKCRKQVASRWDSSGEGEHSVHPRMVEEKISKTYPSQASSIELPGDIRDDNKYSKPAKSRDNSRRTPPLRQSRSPPSAATHYIDKEREYYRTEHREGSKKYVSHRSLVSGHDRYHRSSQSDSRTRNVSPKHQRDLSSRSRNYDEYRSSKNSARRRAEDTAGNQQRYRYSHREYSAHRGDYLRSPGKRGTYHHSNHGSRDVHSRDRRDYAEVRATSRERSRHLQSKDSHERRENDAKPMNRSPYSQNRSCLRKRSRSRSRSRSLLKRSQDNESDTKPIIRKAYVGNRNNGDDHEWGGGPSSMPRRRQEREEKPIKREKVDKTEAEPNDGDGEAVPIQKEEPNFGMSGKLAEETNKVNGVVIAYAEPPGARKPKRRWRLYPFKGVQALPTLHIHRLSCYLIGRDRKICDLPVDHPSCSKQHAVLQYRLVPYERNDGTTSQRVRPYLIDLGSANGTFLNNKPIEPKRYVELHEKDVLKFGFSSREYVLLHENSKEDTEDDEGYDISPVNESAGVDEPAGNGDEETG